MLRILRKNRAQSTLEYAILIVVAIVAFIAIQGYISRAIQGRGRDASDQIGEQFDAGSTTFNYTTHSFANVSELADAWSTTTNYTNQGTTRTGEEHVGNWEALGWGQ